METDLLEWVDGTNANGHKNVVSIKRDEVGGGWTVQTARGFFTYPTLKQALQEARNAA